MNTNETAMTLAERLLRENDALRIRTRAAAQQLAGLEAHVFELQRALTQPARDGDAPGSHFGEPDAPDIERLTRENVALRARLDYCAHVVSGFEDALLHLSDVMQRI